MKQQKYYNFLQKQIAVMIALSLLPGLVYVFFGWVFDILLPSLLWYTFLIFVSFYGLYLYKIFGVSTLALMRATHIKKRFEEESNKHNNGFMDDTYGFIDEPIYRDALLTLARNKP
ncbi:hypothetical protein C9925_01335 [cyanobacterium G8-9]|nr:hypothetical protein C9925_01335 [cyanobacterium G8-9]